MKIERKRGNRSSATALGAGRAADRTFDGYYFALHFTDAAGRDVRVILERQEADAFAQFIAGELARQRLAVAGARKALEALQGLEASLA